MSAGLARFNLTVTGQYVWSGGANGSVSSPVISLARPAPTGWLFDASAEYRLYHSTGSLTRVGLIATNVTDRALDNALPFERGPRTVSLALTHLR